MVTYSGPRAAVFTGGCGWGEGSALLESEATDGGSWKRTVRVALMVGYAAAPLASGWIGEKGIRGGFTIDDGTPLASPAAFPVRGPELKLVGLWDRGAD